MGCLVSKHLGGSGSSPHHHHHHHHNEASPESAPDVDHPKKNGGAGTSSRRPSVQYNRAIDRVEESTASTTISLGNGSLKMTYAYVSQRGRYPDEPFKPNQDAFCIHTPLVGNERDDGLFCVFDGHGKDGDGCAKFAQAQLPICLKEKISSEHANAKTLSKNEMLDALTTSHVETNQQLHADATVDDSLSGTTAVSIYFHGRHNRITVSNVGDSRAVLGQQQPLREGQQRAPGLKALPLSRDQTPYRRDERARIRKTGARVISLDQLEGLEPIPDEDEEEGGPELVLGDQLDQGGDPPRVWHATQDYPGTAFTRSIGDALAEELGVYAEPEMLTRQLQPHDKMLVIASDGVYEFLTNQSVIDICAKFTDPLEACRAVVAEAYELWLQYELRTDDITIICIFLDAVERPQTPSLRASAPKLTTQLSNDKLMDDAELEEQESKPVRTHISKEKQKEIEKYKTAASAAPTLPDEPVDLQQLATVKTPAEKAAIADAIKASVMFRNISFEQRELVYACMESIPVKAGTWVIRQGEQGDRFYIVDDGIFEVRILPEGEADLARTGGHIVHHYNGSRESHRHPSFGDLALMHSVPRTASVVAQTDGHLWALHRAAFRQILIQASDARKEANIALQKYFPNEAPEAIRTLVQAMEETTLPAGQYVIQQGQPAQHVYVIRSGTAYSTAVTPSGETKRKQLSQKGLFGAATGVYKETVMTMQPCKCWTLSVDVVKQLDIKTTTTEDDQDSIVEC